MAESTITRSGPGDSGPGDPPRQPDASTDDEPRVRWITRRRLAKWNRPPHPRDWRWFVAGVGRVLIATGLLLFGFVAYQLWGTGIETARSQRALTTEFEALLATTAPPVAAPPVGAPPTVAPIEDPDEPVTPPEPAGPAIDDGTAGQDDSPLENEVPAFGPIEPGEPVARLEIPSIGVDWVVVSGIGVEDLKKGPGHFPGTPFPGQYGNAALAGHRTTHGQPFRNVDQLEPGDEIVVTTIQGTFVYLVTGTQIVSPQDSHVVATTRTDIAELTLVSCHPVLSAAERIIISAELDETRSSPAVEPTLGATDDPDATDAPLPVDEPLPADPDLPAEPEEPAATDDTIADDTSTDDTSTDDTAADDGDSAAEPEIEPDVDEPEIAEPELDEPETEPETDAEIDDAFARGWFHDPDAYGEIAVWGLLLTVVSVLAYGLSRLTRRDLVGLVVGVAPFTVAAFFFFQNVNRLLPPGL